MYDLGIKELVIKYCGCSNGCCDDCVACGEVVDYFTLNNLQVPSEFLEAVTDDDNGNKETNGHGRTSRGATANVKAYSPKPLTSREQSPHPSTQRSPEPSTSRSSHHVYDFDENISLSSDYHQPSNYDNYEVSPADQMIFDTLIFQKIYSLECSDRSSLFHLQSTYFTHIPCYVKRQREKLSRMFDSWL